MLGIMGVLRYDGGWDHVDERLGQVLERAHYFGYGLIALLELKTLMASAFSETPETFWRMVSPARALRRESLVALRLIQLGPHLPRRYFRRTRVS